MLFVGIEDAIQRYRYINPSSPWGEELFHQMVMTKSPREYLVLGYYFEDCRGGF